MASGTFGTKNGEIDTLVLGCTHYPLVLPAFRQAVGSAVHIVDNGQAVAKRVAALIASVAAPVLAPAAAKQAGSDPLLLLSSATDHHLASAATRWL
jgi:glutamate racemase